LITKIHERYYDLTDFKHPGGPIAIGLIDGRDGTELFESHHLFTEKDVLGMLAAFEVKGHPDNIESSGVYDWTKTKTDPFTLELKAAARKVLGKDIKATPARFALTWSLFLLTMIQLPAFLRGEWWTLLTFPVALWIHGVNVFHDASHFSLSRNWRINALGTEVGFNFCAPYVWYHQHVIGHHSFPNVPGKDPDLYHAAELYRHTEDNRFRSPHKYQTFTWIFVWLIGVPEGLIRRAVAQVVLGKKAFNRVVPFRSNEHVNADSLYLRTAIFYLLVRGVPLLMHGLTLKGLIFALVPEWVFSVCFMLSSQINHLVPDAIDKRDVNFFKH